MINKKQLLHDISLIKALDEFKILINNTIFKYFDEEFIFTDDTFENNKNKFIDLIINLSEDQLEAIFDIHDPLIINQNEINIKNNNVIEIKNVTSLDKNLFDNFINLNKIHVLNECNMNLLHIGNIYIKNIKFDYYFEKDITLLQYFVKLNSLTFDFSFNKSIKPLTYLFNLKSLAFGSSFNQPIDSLRYLKNLNKLRFGTKFNQPINSLANLINLKKLILNSTNFTYPIECLGNLTKLESLFINSTKYNHSIDVLNKLVNLTKLNFFGLAVNPDSIVHLIKLKELKLTFSDPYMNLSFFFENISNLINLENLSLANYKSIYNINPEHYNNLKNLSLYINNPITLTKLHKIEKLSITHNSIINLQSITHNYKTLIDLNINGFDCDIGLSYNNPLEKLINLEYLELNMTSINNINFLSKLENLKGLILNTIINNFSIDILNQLKKLICLSIFNNNNINLTNIKLNNLKYLFTTNFDYIDLQNYYIVSIDNKYFIYNSELISYSRFIEKILLENACKYNDFDEILVYINQIKNRQYIYN